MANPTLKLRIRLGVVGRTRDQGRKDQEAEVDPRVRAIQGHARARDPVVALHPTPSGRGQVRQLLQTTMIETGDLTAELHRKGYVQGKLKV